MEINKFSQQFMTNLPKYEKVEPVKDPQMHSERAQENRKDPNVDVEELETVIKSVNEFLIPSESDIKFTLHEELNEYYVAIIDHQTKEVIREIPPKKLLDMYAEMIKPLGLLLDKKI